MDNQEGLQEYLVGFAMEALSRLKPHEQQNAWWEIDWAYRMAVLTTILPDGRPAYQAAAGKDWREGTFLGLPFRMAETGRIRLYVGSAANPYEAPPTAVFRLDEIPIAIVYERRGEPWCIVVTERWIEDSPVAAVLPRSSMGRSGLAVQDVGRAFADHYFRRHLANALKQRETGAP